MLIAQWKSSKPDTAYAGVKPEAFPDRSSFGLLSRDNTSIPQSELNPLSANRQCDRDGNHYRYEKDTIPARSELVSPDLLHIGCARMADAFGLAPMILQPSC